MEAASTLTSVASKAVAAAQGPLHAIRGTGESERMLKNAKTEYHNEAEEIATYTGIEALAGAVNDKETVKLARGIRREEERMAKFLEKQIPQLAKAVAKEEIPAAERRNGASASRRSSSRTPVRGVSAWGLDRFPVRARTARLGSFEQCRVADYIFDPKLPHHPLHILSAEANSIRMFVAELTLARHPPNMGARVWRKSRSSRLMNDPLRRNIELVPSD